ncbi:UNVERIFIED_ORG: hypothetical protein GGD51_004365 [Rhizobium esperanzae]
MLRDETASVELSGSAVFKDELAEAGSEKHQTGNPGP